ncbi:MAG TPA: magnesium transporter, partial [Actinomycetota bacterium]|nr:magnesium transporter [Actinomycetota bacterium]
SVPEVALARRARTLWAYWRAERRTRRQGFVALVLSTLASFVAGLTLGAITGTLEELPGLLILIPASVGMRGVISGATGARLGTSIAAGLFDASWSKGGVLRQNATLGLVLTLGSSLYVAGLARMAAVAFGEPSIPLLDLVTISVVGGTVGAALVLLATIGLAVVSFRRGYDLDAVGTPVITAVGDMVTLPAIFLATLLVRSGAVRDLVAAMCLAAAAVGIVAGIRAEPAIRRTLIEMTGVLLIVPILDVLAGTLLESQSARFFLYPGLLILVPPLISQAGALGGILSSRLSSKLRLGVITPRGRPEPPALVDAALVVTFGLAIFTFIGVLGSWLADLVGEATPDAATTVWGTVFAGILLLPIILALGYYLAIGTTRFGLDPDNHTVPINTGVMDLAGVVAFVVSMSLLGVAVHG